jgi:type VI secretion system secreted protein Hcp
MAFDAFMWITGNSNCPVEGETQDKDFQPMKAFEIKSFKIEVKNPTSMGSSGGGAGTGKCQLEPFEVGKVTDNCSPSLFKCCSTGQHYTDAVIAVRKAGGGGAHRTGMVYLKYTFRCVFVNQLTWNGSSGDDLPEETVQFAYGSVTIEYWQQSEKGDKGPRKNLACWNQVTNTDKPEVNIK